MLVKFISAKNFDTSSVKFSGEISRSACYRVLQFSNENEDVMILYQCQYETCNRVLQNLYKMTDHLRSHTKEKPF